MYQHISHTGRRRDGHKDIAKLIQLVIMIKIIGIDFEGFIPSPPGTYKLRCVEIDLSKTNKIK